MSGEAATTGDTDVRPVVRTGSGGNRGVWLFAGALAFGGLLLFNALSNRREEMAASTTLPVVATGGMIAAPPPLTLPPGYADAPYAGGGQLAGRRQFATIEASAPEPQVITRIIERPAPEPTPATPPATFPPAPSAPVPVVIQNPALAQAAASAAAGAERDRVTAGRLLNPSFTVPQGVIIAAVLETALDSTRAGGARAIVSRDVRSFDGSRVLIPRGSRLYGEYAADMSAGQKRALVRWQRLTRPDAVIIELDSPSADPLGRAGIAGKVDTHFLERFGGAILQSVLDIGVGLATRSVADGTVIVGLPGSTQQVTGQHQAAQIQPTLRVRQGTSVSVFVARDLDFSTVDR